MIIWGKFSSTQYTELGRGVQESPFASTLLLTLGLRQAITRGDGGTHEPIWGWQKMKWMHSQKATVGQTHPVWQENRVL